MTVEQGRRAKALVGLAIRRIADPHLAKIEKANNSRSHRRFAGSRIGEVVLDLCPEPWQRLAKAPAHVIFPGHLRLTEISMIAVLLAPAGVIADRLPKTGRAHV